MKTPSTSLPNPVPPGIITQRQFDEYAANWVAASSDPEGTELAQSFRVGKNQQLLASLSLPVLQIARLVSTVGAAHIKARFLIIRDEKTQQPHFSLVLFATDALDARISSYYLAEQYWLPATRSKAAPNNSAPAASLRPVIMGATRTEVPDVLARHWLRLWAELTQVTPALFATSYGPLRGYTFEVAEFMTPLRQLSDFGHEKLVLEFDLHEYYRTEPQGEVLVHTFGLVLRLESLRVQGVSGPFINMGQPCPPHC